jgi:uncharacterized protein (TIGR03437 family)
MRLGRHRVSFRLTLIFVSSFTWARIDAQPTPGSITTHRLLLTGQSVIDQAGNVYATTSYTPVDLSNYGWAPTPGAAQTTSGGGQCYTGTFLFMIPNYSSCSDAFIAKVDSTGKTVYATLLGGPTPDTGVALAADASGNVYVTGTTGGSFPTTANAAIPTSSSSHAFVAKLSADGSRFIYSTYLPDTMATVLGIGLDPQGDAYVVGATPSHGACVIKINTDGSSFPYSTVLAGASQLSGASATAIVVDAAGNAVVTGYTSFSDFPVSAYAFQSQLGGAQNAFVTKLDPNGNIVFSTFLGGSGSDEGYVVQTDSDGDIYVAGETTSSDFPTTQGSFQPTPLVPAWSTSLGGFIAKLSPDGSVLVYSSYVVSYGAILNLAVGVSGDAYLTGITQAGFPITASAPQPCLQGNKSLFAAHLDSQGSLLDATYLGDQNPQRTLGLNVALDGSLSLVAAFLVETGSDFTYVNLSRIRFNEPGWIPKACMSSNVLNSTTLIGSSRVAPGEFITLTGFGIGPENGISYQRDAQGQAPLLLGGVQVFFDGKPAPVVYVQSRQVNAQVPFEISGKSYINISLQYDRTTFGPVTDNVTFADPGLLRLQPNVSALAYAVNQDQTINGPLNPAPAGSVIALWGTGFGSTDPACKTGGLNAPGPNNLAPGLSVDVLSGTQVFSNTTSGNVTYAGGAPTLPCGVFQINMPVPSTNAPPGALTLTPWIVLAEPDGFGDPISAVFAPIGAIIYVK